LRNLFVLAVAAVPFAAVAQTTSGVVWKGDFESGAAAMSGNCTAGQNQWCRSQTIRPQQIQAVQSPVAQGGYAARIEVKFGDVYGGYSDERSLLTGPSTLWETAGTEKWYRWQSMLPDEWVGKYPKWDQLADFPNAYSIGGWLVEWHHDANGGVETGSAPLYIGADDSKYFLCLVDQATSACRETIKLADLQRGHWTDFVVHALWSPDSNTGFLEIWVDGVNVLPKHYGSNMYPGMRNYLCAGLYRNVHIGDPGLRWPDGTPVYGAGGSPSVAYLDGFIIGKTMDDVLAERPWGTQPEAPPPPPPPPPPAPGAGPDQPPATPVPEPSPDAAPPQVGAATLGSGCSSTRAQSAWIAIGLVVLLMRRRFRAKEGRA
jgi:hypothetical protein